MNKLQMGIPLDRFAYPDKLAEAGLGAAQRLDGVDRRNRAPPAGEPFAANDYEAIQRCLATVADRPNMARGCGWQS